jgi:hypothetical protein
MSIVRRERLTQQKCFGSSSGKTNPNQLELNLFNEVKVLVTHPDKEPLVERLTYEKKNSTCTPKRESKTVDGKRTTISRSCRFGARG